MCILESKGGCSGKYFDTRKQQTCKKLGRQLGCFNVHPCHAVSCRAEQCMHAVGYRENNGDVMSMT